ncbi:MAG: hypothetical protein QOH47_3105 [Sphingomonadales bacterium]|jgi:hypothetical protein|nr:hypothetical protein [Sphingomonadales bacterium]
MVTSTIANQTIADYCDALGRNAITVNRDYQRSDEVWPEAARSFLIESLLLGYPMPKIYLHSFTDLKTKKTRKEIVDGQQRSKTILDFFKDNLSMSKASEIEEIRGLKYSELPPEWQEKFISYHMSIDQFVGAEPAEVRQIFRRMNSYTVPLSPEEMRNAEFQGKLKWFLYGEAQKYGAVIALLEIYSERALVRMLDLKLLAEIAHAMKKGVSTTNAATLKNFYRDNDVRFPEEKAFTKAFAHAFGTLSKMTFIAGSNLAKPYMIYSLALALVHQVHPIPRLRKVAPKAPMKLAAVERSLMSLSASLDLSDAAAKRSPHRAFITASSKGTNVKEARLRRINAFLDALGAQ